MRLSETESNLIKDNNYYIIGTSISGENNYIGPMVSCSVVLDYSNLSPVKEFLSTKNITKETIENLFKSFLYYTTYITKSEDINSLRDIKLSEHKTKFNCANKLVWNMLKKCEVPDAYLTSDTDLTEVVDTLSDSLHTERPDRYVLWNKDHSLELITPKAIFKSVPTNKSITTRVAKKIADMILLHELKSIDAKLPKYKVLDFPGKEQEKYVSMYGNTVYHRVFLPELKKYPLGRLINDE